MNILITGGNGFIGRSLIDSLPKAVKAHCLIRPTTNLDFFVERKLNTVIDDKNTVKIREYCINNNIIGVVHLASLYINSHTSGDIESLVESNISYGLRLLEAIKNTSVSWFINIGTSWQHYNNEKYNPVNLYAATKMAFETMAEYYLQTTNLNFVTLKLFDTYGPGDTRSKILNLLYRYSKSGEALKMSPGNQVMDICFIDDVISALLLMLNLLKNDEHNIYKGRSYSISSSERMTLREVVETFEKVIRKPINIEWGALAYRDREVMMPWCKGEVVPGWKPMTSLFDGLKKTFGEK